ncbi:MAG: Sip1-related alpha-galactosidase, partial [Faecousia sp.]
MNTGKVFLRLSNGELQESQIIVTETVQEGVHGVFIDGLSPNALDGEFGAGMELRVDGLKSWMADYRHSEYWCCPAFGTDFSQVPEETQGLIYEKTDGSYGVILPVVSQQYKCVLTGSGPDAVLAKLFSWCENMTACKALAVLWAEGDNPYGLLEKCVSVGLKLLGTGCRTRRQRRYPELFEYLGWCSWDAFEIRVDEKSLLAKCREFKDKGIPVKWAILDDMWAEVRDFYGREYKTRPEMFQLMHSSRLYSFRADPIRFPNGLKACIQKINDFGIQVGMWHPTTGYWMGADPEGEAYGLLKDCLIRTGPGIYIHSPDQDKAYRFYCTLHDYLRKCGAEFLKIDNQSMIRRFYKGIGSVGQLARQIHDAMEASVGQHFDNQMINCMGMASEDMWNRSVSPISRCSDDFLPENKAWFTKHILQCAYNCLIQGQF